MTTNGVTSPAALALLQHGFDGERLTRLAHRVANDYLRLHGATLGSRYDDLVQFLCLHGLKAALNFDTGRNHSTYGSNGGDVFASYLADVLENRCTDFYRSKAEGFGDARYGNNDRIVLSPMDEDPDSDEFEDLLNEKQTLRYRDYWYAAAQAENMRTLSRFTLAALNDRAEAILGLSQREWERLNRIEMAADKAA